MNFKLSKILVILAIIFASFYGIIKLAIIKSSENNDADSKKFIVVTSFYPVYISTINITKDMPDIKVVNMTKPQTGCLHDYSLTPEDMKTLEKAKVFVINGAGMEAFMQKVLNQYPHLKIIEASRGIELIKDKTGEPNPHIWVSISDNILQIKNISSALGEFDAKNKKIYDKNSEAYIEKLEKQKNKMHEILDKYKNRNIITFHEAFPYFAKEFNLNIAAVIEREPGSEPSAQEIKETIEIIKKHKVKAIFAEPQYSAKSAGTISAETGIKLYTLDPAVSGEINFDAYIKIMDNNLKSLAEALK